MRILVITQYFWPENFRVNDLCLELKNRGHAVSILTGKPNYPNGNFFNGYSFFSRRTDYWNGLKIYRVPLLPRGNGSGFNLFFNYFSFTFFSCLRIFFINEKFDKIIVYQLSPGTIGFPALVAKNKFKAKLFFYIQDLWPESIIDASGLNSKIIIIIIDKMMNWFYYHSNEIWVQSDDFKHFLKNKGVDIGKIHFIPNTVEVFYKPLEFSKKHSELMPNGFNIVFAGNIGKAQNIDTLIDAMKIINDKRLKVNLVILGNGREMNYIKEKIFKYNLDHCIFLLGTYPSVEMPYFFSCADALIVSLKKSTIFKITIPSKIQSYLACGKPIIGSIEGVGSKIIIDSKSGFCSKPNDEIGLSFNIQKMYLTSTKERINMGINARNYFLKNFERVDIYNRIVNRLNN